MRLQGSAQALSAYAPTAPPVKSNATSCTTRSLRKDAAVVSLPASAWVLRLELNPTVPLGVVGAVG